jgi:uncharacterized Fe-S cluster protein YjdI
MSAISGGSHVEPTGSPDREDPDASAGGAGAPPVPDDRNRAPAGLTREYVSGDLRVRWFAERCIHSGECIRALPRVFNPRRRPWIDIHAAGADAIVDAVERCPTGALQYVTPDGASGQPAPETTTIRAVRNGPLYVRGPVRIEGSDGTVLREDTRVALCRCGQSRHMPFCDNSHRTNGFREAQ